ncbi:nicotinate-nucleotide adenylyltransferase [Lacinutrix sp. Bg11-31]|uniref:nicotinate-nucleotide adenylyltransferase n=1 Tax=Lacinutrix sp. Bg11-31 TaxID=2057808 RepID=UPI000C3137DA|nr:nicotinate-nucleotide adenylyltransferase [Lacinutrix sp. Bg11-31]AUC81252.1 nicotinate-nucleotide adenylyltransferase [Lacinutrix sp. Bg11-31]
MKKVLFILIALGLTSQVYAQDPIELEEIVISVSYKYLNAAYSPDSDSRVKTLEKEVALYDIKNAEFYSDEYDNYSVSFFIPDGKIVAAYNKEGDVIRTIERFEDVKLPKDVRDAVAKRFPNWSIVKDVYSVKFHKGNNVAKKQYKIKLKNGEEIVRVKTDEYGTFL